MLPRPRIRLPLWAALAIPGAAYVVRSLVIRNGDFSPDMPGDLIVAIIIIAALILVGQARASNGEEATEDHAEDTATDTREDATNRP
ncbi:MAG: hypothetical protein U1E26_05555 [Coriobacteriia bacterium]|nr:hypothetical protein [Coriobacteriia bacterium]